jgi:TolB-like protein/Flp pilus assembly protein TadD
MSAEKDREPLSTVSSQANMPAGAVFLSYASEDAAAAERIAAALRTAGIEVWFDRSELRGGDAWDRRIRDQIHECRLFIALISAHTEGRDEGYFRREWKLAVDRTHDMLEKKAFLLPVAIDATPARGSAVPDKFHEVQWTRLIAGEASASFVERVRRLLSPEAAATPLAGSAQQSLPFSGPRPRVRSSAWVVAAALVAALAVGYLAYERLAPKRTAPGAPGSVPSPVAASFNPSPHSIAVLPFVNMSGDKEQEYFSDGLTEEILNSLARIGELQVSARTSSFSFKGKDTDLATIAHKLNVGSVLEGSVRRSGNTIRVTAQLNNAATGFHLWSQTYDRDLRDVLKLQTEIADAVANALKVTLLGDVAAKVEAGGTRNPLAFDAYLRGLRLTHLATNEREAVPALDAYAEAIRIDPNFALAYASRSLALVDFAYQWGSVTAHRLGAERARVDAEQAIALAPDLGVAHAALGRYLEWALDYPRATEESERALALAPGNATVLYEYSQHAAYMGHMDAAIDIARKGVALDPLNLLSHRALGDALWFARRYDEANAAYQDASAVNPGPPEPYARRGLAYYALGSNEMARSTCEQKPEHWESWLCLAVTFDRLGQRRESEAEIKKMTEFSGDALAYQFAQIYAQRGDRDRALEWLDTAMRLRDPGFRRLRNDPLLDTLRNEPRFQAIEQELKFSN